MIDLAFKKHIELYNENIALFVALKFLGYLNIIFSPKI
jgi:hypothetical protein